MKTKKIISLLLTVAMVATCGLTAFAAPTGYESYVQSTTTEFNGLDGASIYGVLPDPATIRADFEVTNMTDAEFLTEMGCTPQQAAADMGLTLPDTWVDSTYFVTISLYNLGTISSVAKKQLNNYKYGGLKINGVNITLEGSDDILIYGRYDGNLNTDNDVQYNTRYFYQFNDGTAQGGYPKGETSDTTMRSIENASIENALQLMIFAKPGAEIDIKDANVTYQNSHEGTINVDTSGNPVLNASAALWHPASITLGEADNKVEKAVKATTKFKEGLTGLLFKVNNGTKTAKYAVKFATTVEKGNDISIGLKVTGIPSDITLDIAAEDYYEDAAGHLGFVE